MDLIGEYYAASWFTNYNLLRVNAILPTEPFLNFLSFFGSFLTFDHAMSFEYGTALAHVDAIQT